MRLYQIVYLLIPTSTHNLHMITYNDLVHIARRYTECSLTPSKSEVSSDEEEEEEELQRCVGIRLYIY